MSPADPNAAIPAATLILMRERDGAPPELLMVERAAVMAFAGGALVFPGGRVDSGDRLLAAAAGDPDDRAARIAAIRETIEETGIAVGLSPSPDAGSIAALRDGLAAGEDFGELLADAGIALDHDALVPFARWEPPSSRPRRFDTRFYIARAPAGATQSPDGAETVAAFWAPAAEIIARATRGEARIIFPTRRNLERLARFACFAEAEDDAARHPVTTIVARVEERNGEDWLCIPEGLGYPITGEPMADAMRA